MLLIRATRLPTIRATKMYSILIETLTPAGRQGVLQMLSHILIDILLYVALLCRDGV